MEELERFFGIAFKVVTAREPNDTEGRTVFVSAIGTGYVNFSKREQ